MGTFLVLVLCSLPEKGDATKIYFFEDDCKDMTTNLSFASLIFLARCFAADLKNGKRKGINNDVRSRFSHE